MSSPGARGSTLCFAAGSLIAARAAPTNASSMRCAALCLAALLAAPTLAQDYSGLCMTPANYQGGAMYDHEISPAVTCDAIMAHWTSSGNTLAGKDWLTNSCPTCDGWCSCGDCAGPLNSCDRNCGKSRSNPTWGADLNFCNDGLATACYSESYDVKNVVNIVASYCCGTGDAASRRSACWADYSHVCATPANYQGGAMYDHELSQAVTCDQAMDSFTTSGSNLAGKDFSSAFSCPAESYNVKGTVNIVASYCCGTGDAASQRSACWADYSHICADPTRWTPSGEWEAASASNGNTAVSCQQVMDYYTEDGKTLYGDDFSSASTAAESCTGKDPSTINAVHGAIAAKCCASGNSVCHSDTVDSATLGGRVASAVGVVSVFAVLLGFH